MKFAIDRQTLDDLNLLGKYKTNSIFNLYNQTITKGGESILEQMFQNPLTDADAINTRKEIINFFSRENLSLPFTREEFKLTESYLENSDYRNSALSIIGNLRRYFKKLIANDKEYDTLVEGVLCAVTVIKKLKGYVKEISKLSGSNPYFTYVVNALKILEDKKLSWIYTFDPSNEISFTMFAWSDHRMRYSISSQLKELMLYMNYLDLYVSVSGVGKKRGYVFAVANDSRELNIDIKGLYHPCVPAAVANDLNLSYENNVLFLTGANMAGKSTLMKSFGICIYLAHMGFPVAAKWMEFNVCNGIYTSINVPDNLNMGYSHFYAEVVRVKKIATEVASGKNLIVIFDELFKGTNVKDAYDATVAITESFSKIHECAFIVSTHIMEAGIKLKESCNNIVFKYLPSVLKGKVPTYPYILEDGISNDRHGMMIINNERIIETINGG
jgi:DNA mismatch repair ATPase MutS